MLQNFSCGCPGNPKSVDSTTLILARIDPDAKVTVKFHLRKNHTVAQVYTDRWTIGELLDDVAKKFKVDATYLALGHEQDGEGPLPESVPLYELPRNEFGIIDLKLGLSAAGKKYNDDDEISGPLIYLDPGVFYRLL